ncbi:MAG: transposase [Tepidisphaeraceae bacterium]
MSRQARNTPAGLVYHVLNRANGRLRLFRKDEDFLAFEKVLLQAMRRRPVRLLDWCLMSNHWHFVVWPRKDDDLSEFFRWLTHTHTQRWHAHHATSGMGHVYQGRFKCFPVQEDGHLERLLRYVQLNPLRAKLVRRAVAWRWGTCHVRRRGPVELAELLSDWPIDRPRDWDAWLDEGLSATESERIVTAIRRSCPLGDPAWTERIASRLNLEHTLNPLGRPKRDRGNESRPL